MSSTFVTISEPLTSQTFVLKHEKKNIVDSCRLSQPRKHNKVYFSIRLSYSVMIKSNMVKYWKLMVCNRQHRHTQTQMQDLGCGECYQDQSFIASFWMASWHCSLTDPTENKLCKFSLGANIKYILLFLFFVFFPDPIYYVGIFKWFFKLLTGINQEYKHSIVGKD